MNSDLQQLVMGLFQLDRRVIADLGQLEVEQLTNAMERVQRLLKGLKKRDVPPQLERNHEWVKYVLDVAEMNGWESFVMRTTKTDKSTVLKDRNDEAYQIFCSEYNENVSSMAPVPRVVRKTSAQVAEEKVAAKMEKERERAMKGAAAAAMKEERMRERAMKDAAAAAMKEERMREKAAKEEDKVRQKEEKMQARLAALKQRLSDAGDA